MAVAAMAGTALFAALSALVPTSRGSILAEHVLLALAAAGAGGACALAARSARGRTAWSWRLLAVAGACWSAGHLAAALTRVPGHEMHWWAGVGFPLASPAIIAAVLFFPGAPLRWAGRGRTLVDGLIIGACALFVAWELGLAETYRDATSTLAHVALGQTDARGRFRVKSLAEGSYRVVVKSGGYSMQKRAVNVSENAGELSFTLHASASWPDARGEQR